MAKDTYYFSHDYNARTDSKIKMLLRKHGIAGYGLFWCIIEDLYNNANALPLDCECIAFELRADISLVKSVIYDFGLFEVSENTFKSASVQRRMEEREYKSRKARSAANARWNNANAMRTHQVSNAIKERKGKEIKEEEDKEEEKPSSPPSVFLNGLHIDGFLELDINKQKCLSDEMFVAMVCTSGIIKESVPDWLDAFNRSLQFEGKTHKQHSDYRKHFRNWVKFKYGTDPKSYHPVAVEQKKEESKGVNLLDSKYLIQQREAKERENRNQCTENL